MLVLQAAEDAVHEARQHCLLLYSKTLPVRISDREVLALQAGLPAHVQQDFAREKF